jgi:hypothetical protein
MKSKISQLNTNGIFFQILVKSHIHTFLKESYGTYAEKELKFATLINSENQRNHKYYRTTEYRTSFSKCIPNKSYPVCS